MSAVARLTIRDAVVTDLRALSRQLAQLGYPTPPEVLGGRLLALARDGQTRILVADTGAGAAGFLALTRMDILPYREPLARITAMCVEADCRSAGVGSALEARAAEIARDWGCDRIEVTSNRRRVRAHGFYRRQGYEETHRCFVKQVRGAGAGGDGGAKD